MRLINRPLAFVLALALLALGALTAAEVIAHAVNAKPLVVHWPVWYRWGERTQWNRAVVKVSSIVLIIVGSALLYIQLKPRRVSRLTMVSDDAATDAAMTRKGLANALRAAAVDIDGIRAAKVTVAKRAAVVVATAAAQDQSTASELKDDVTTSVTDRLDNLRLARPPKLKIRVTSRSS